MVRRPRQGGKPYCHQPGCDLPQNDRLDARRRSLRGIAAGSVRRCPGDGTWKDHANHIATTQSCDTCHKTTAWTPATFSTAVSSREPVRAATTVPPPAAKCQPHSNDAGCDTCHKNSAWTPARSATLASAQAARHLPGVTAKGKSGNHRSPARQLRWLPSRRAWTPAVVFPQ